MVPELDSKVYCRRGSESLQIETLLDWKVPYSVQVVCTRDADDSVELLAPGLDADDLFDKTHNS